MDKETKDFIKECDCPEIQGLWKPKEGDTISVKGKTYCVFQDAGCNDFGKHILIAGGYCIEKKNTVWLPSLEQIIAEIMKKGCAEWTSGWWGFNNGYYFTVHCKESIVNGVGDTIELSAIKALKQVLKGGK